MGKEAARNFKTGTDLGNLGPVKFAIVADNNHYAGFGPGIVNIFRQLIGLEEVKWGDDLISIDDPTVDTKDDKSLIGQSRQIFLIFESGMNKGRMSYCSMCFPTVFLSLVLFTLTNLSFI